MRIPKGGVAFFDSGIGGLTVMATCKKICPNEIFYYYGDNQHAPYGNLPPEKIKRLVYAAFDKFSELKVKAVVVACNTATALCVEGLRQTYPFPIIGAEPAVFSAAKNGGNVFVLSTRATYNSERFKRLCERAKIKYPKANILPVSCDLLAGKIEENVFNKTFDYTSFLPLGKPDSVVLGCTHYVYIKNQIEDFYACAVYDGNEGMAKRLASFLEDSPKQKVSENTRNFFLGEAKGSNKRIFEQMFGYFWVPSGQKSQKN